MRRPRLIIFDVNETLSDMAPLADRFVDVGAPAHLAGTWFTGLLRDGFALTCVGASDAFARLAEESLHVGLHGQSLNRTRAEAVAHVMDGLTSLGVHHDVPDGIRALSAQGIRLVTLSNGAASVAAGLLDGAGVREHVELLLSVEDAGAWKPAEESYAYALQQCGVEADDAMLVAVHPWDVDGASRAGLATAWINRSGGPYPAYFRPATLVVSSVADLADQLGQAHG